LLKKPRKSFHPRPSAKSAVIPIPAFRGLPETRSGFPWHTKEGKVQDPRL
jgi:hypothetical protein